MTTPPEIDKTIQLFTDIYLVGIPLMLNQNGTAFLSFVCTVAATDALAAYRYKGGAIANRFQDFVRDYYPTEYATHAAALWNFRNRMLHNFSPAGFSLVHEKAHPGMHFQKSAIGDTILSDARLYDALKYAAEKFFTEIHTDQLRQVHMLDRLRNPEHGGQIDTTPTSTNSPLIFKMPRQS